MNGQSTPLDDKNFIKIFGGGANCYIPDFLGGLNRYIPDSLGGGKLNVTALAAGILACILFIVLQIRSHKERIRKGYETEALMTMIIRMVIISMVVLWFSYKLSTYKGIPTALLWVLAVIIIYGYITSKTTIGRYFYAVGGNEKAAKLSGVNTNKIYFLAYINMGLIAALAGMLTIARMNLHNQHMDRIMRWMPLVPVSLAVHPLMVGLVRFLE